MCFSREREIVKSGLPVLVFEYNHLTNHTPCIMQALSSSTASERLTSDGSQKIQRSKSSKTQISYIIFCFIFLLNEVMCVNWIGSRAKNIFNAYAPRGGSISTGEAKLNILNKKETSDAAIALDNGSISNSTDVDLEHGTNEFFTSDYEIHATKRDGSLEVVDRAKVWIPFLFVFFICRSTCSILLFANVDGLTSSEMPRVMSNFYNDIPVRYIKPIHLEKQLRTEIKVRVETAYCAASFFSKFVPGRNVSFVESFSGAQNCLTNSYLHIER